MPGSRQCSIARMPAASHAAMQAAELVVHLAHDIGVDRLVIHRGEVAAHVHQHHRARTRGDQARQPGSWVSAVTSLTIAAPASSAARMVLGVAGVDGHAGRPRLPARGSPAGRVPAPRRAGRLRAGPGALATHVDDVSASPAMARPVRMARSGSRCAPPSLKLSGVTFNTPMTRGRSRGRPAQVCALVLPFHPVSAENRGAGATMSANMAIGWALAQPTLSRFPRWRRQRYGRFASHQGRACPTLQKEAYIRQPTHNRRRPPTCPEAER